MIRSGGEFKTVFWTVLQRRAASEPSITDFAITALTAIALGWFTYFSKSKQVTDADKFAVFLMFCGAAIGLVTFIVRHVTLY